MSSAGRSRRRKHRRPPPGTAPGVLAVDPGAPAPRLDALRYDEAALETLGELTAPELAARRSAGSVLWLDVVGLGDAARLQAVADAFGIHPLAMEDVVHLDQRPKAELYGEQAFLVLRMHSPGVTEGEQLSLVLGSDFVITFQEREGDCFGGVRERLRRVGGLRRNGADYLAYALLDAAIDAYRPVVEATLDELELLEEHLLAHPAFDPVPHLHGLRRRLTNLRHQVLPLRELLIEFARNEAGLLRPDTAVFLRDCQDHVSALRDAIEGGRELINSLVDMSVALVGRRMNEVMQVLTVIATLFIPLSFVAGVFGMNFDPSVSDYNMPELRQPWGYPAALALMSAVAVSMLLWFRRRGWIGSTGASLPPPASPRDQETRDAPR